MNTDVVRRTKKKKRVILFFKIFFMGLTIGVLSGMAFSILIFRQYFEKTSLNSAVDSSSVSMDASSSALEELPQEDTSDSTYDTERTPYSELYKWDDKWTYAEFSKIHEDDVILYHSTARRKKSYVVAVNAGHGTANGSSVMTQCHPDGTPKVTGGSTAEGAINAAAVTSGTTLLDGTEEATATLLLATKLKQELLDAGYDVLMLRETDDCRLDNVARTVFANQFADCHIAIHYDSTENDKGFYYISVPENDGYRKMEPVASHWQQHTELGEKIISGVKTHGVPIFGSGSMAVDLTQTSYSTIPSVDLEVGDRASSYSDTTLNHISQGIVLGIENYRSRSESQKN